MKACSNPLYRLKFPSHEKISLEYCLFSMFTCCLVFAIFSSDTYAQTTDEITRCNSEPTDMTIEYADVITCEIETNGDRDIFRFMGQEGEEVTLQGGWREGSMRPCIELVSPGNISLESCNNAFTNRIDTRLSETGEYSIIVKSRSATTVGKYTLVLESIIPHSQRTQRLEYSSGIEAQISPAGDIDIFVFLGRNGDRININAAWQSGGMRPCIELISPENRRLESCENAFSNHIETTLTVSGDHIILVHSWSPTGSGQYTVDLQCLSREEGSCVPTPTPTPTSTPTTTPSSNPSLTLIYAVLDNDLGDDPETWARLVNNAEAGVHDGVNVRLFVDGPRAEDDEEGPDAYIYDLQADNRRFCPTLDDHTCNGRYQSGESIRDGDENSAHPDTLYNFIRQAIEDHPDAPTISLSLVGHGSGWSAGALPGQPSAYVGQSSGEPITITERIGGLLWDDTPRDGSGSRSLSTRALGYALDRVKRETGRTIDLLYLDACSMGMTEVAYELRESVGHLLASSNTAWASFAYEEMLLNTNGELAAQALGMAWLKAEANALKRYTDHPFTLALIDTDKLGAVKDLSDTLADALAAATSNERDLIVRSAASADRYESNYDGELNESDTYLDFGSLASELESLFAGNSTIRDAASALRTGIADAVVSLEHRGGTPWPYPGREWKWDNLGGLAIYFPAASADPRQAYYTAENLQWAADGRWDDFLAAYWDSDVVAAAQSELPTCASTRDCTQLPKQLDLLDTIHLPVVIR